MTLFRRILTLAIVAVVLLAPVGDAFAQVTGKAPVVKGKFVATGSGTAPTLSACGTATVSGTDTAGVITHTAGASACTLTFNEAFDAAPVCLAQLVDSTTTDQNEGSWVREVAFAAADITIHYEAASSAANKYAYICIGR